MRLRSPVLLLSGDERENTCGSKQPPVAPAIVTFRFKSRSSPATQTSHLLAVSTGKDYGVTVTLFVTGVLEMDVSSVAITVNTRVAVLTPVPVVLYITDRSACR